MKIIEIMPVNISDINKEKRENLKSTFKEFLKECDFDVKIISISTRINLEKQIANMAKYKKNKIYENYQAYLNQLTTKKEMYINKYYVSYSSKNNIQNASYSTLLKEVYDRLQIFLKLESSGIKVIDINKKEDIARILKKLFIGGDENESK